MKNKPKMIKKPIKKNNIDSFKIYIEFISVKNLKFTPESFIDVT